MKKIFIIVVICALVLVLLIIGFNFRNKQVALNSSKKEAKLLLKKHPEAVIDKCYCDYNKKSAEISCSCLGDNKIYTGDLVYEKGSREYSLLTWRVRSKSYKKDNEDENNYYFIFEIDKLR